LNLEHTIADGGRGLRAGQKAALEKTPCYGDIFHAERDLTKVVSYLSNRAERCSAPRKELEGKMDKLKKMDKGNSISKKLACAPSAEKAAVT
jgi:hypothetical protein